jgi:hypothetical protein
LHHQLFNPICKVPSAANSLTKPVTDGRLCHFFSSSTLPPFYHAISLSLVLPHAHCSRCSVI